MRAKVLSVQWHEGQAPIYSVHVSRKKLLATGGQDQKVLLWRLTGNIVEHVATLDEHVATVNCVRWDPQGELLASATDGGDTYGGQLLVWAQEPATLVWRVITRCQVQRDIYDICWSPDGTQISAVGTDTKIRIFDARSGKEVDQFSPHSHYIQGVAWDPRNELLVSESMDRTLVVHSFSPRGTKKYREMSTHVSDGDIDTTGTAPLETKTGTDGPNEAAEAAKKPEDIDMADATNDLSQATTSSSLAFTFLDEKASSYFRRLAFTPDGSILIAPTACITENEQSTKCTLLFTRQGLATGVPYAALPLTTHASIAVACSPFLYQHKGPKLVDCDYACIYAVVTQFLVLIYSTQAREPLGVIADLHPTAITDLSWDSSGKSIIISSMEGFCSLIEFDEGELPEVLERSPLEQATPPAPAAPAPAVPSVVNMLTARRKAKPQPKEEPKQTPTKPISGPTSNSRDESIDQPMDQRQGSALNTIAPQRQTVTEAGSSVTTKTSDAQE